MRGPDEQTADMFSYLSPEARVRADHPLRAIRLMTDQVLRELSPRFDRMYSDMGRPSIPPEQLLRALLLQGLYTIRSERLLMEEIDYSILFRWFIGLSLDEPIWSPTTFSKNRDRLLQADVASAFFDAVVRPGARGRPDVGRALHGRWDAARGVGQSEEFPAQGRRPHRRRPTIRAIRRSISTGRPARTTRISRRPTRTRSCIARARARKRSSRIWGTSCSTTAMAWWPMSVRRRRRARGNGRRRCCCSSRPPRDDRRRRQAFRRRPIRPAACASSASRRMWRRRTPASRIDDRTTRHPGYAISQRKRKLIEQVFGWMKTIGGLRKLRHRGGELVDWIVTFTAAAYNLVRLRTLLARPA